MLGGLVTTVPLLFFGAAARRLRLSTLGMLQYLGPTLQLLLATVFFGEPFHGVKIVSFACIWTAIILYSADSLHASRQSPTAVVEPTGADL
jgi:chloramphenicol-sensitive protein RarD